MRVFSKSAAAFLVLFLVGVMAHAGDDSVSTRPFGPNEPYSDESNQADDWPDAPQSENAPQAYWDIYYKLRANSGETIYHYSDGSLAKFSSEQTARDIAQHMVNRKQWYSARWREVGR